MKGVEALQKNRKLTKDQKKALFKESFHQRTEARINNVDFESNPPVRDSAAKKKIVPLSEARPAEAGPSRKVSRSRTPGREAREKKVRFASPDGSSIGDMTETPGQSSGHVETANPTVTSRSEPANPTVESMSEPANSTMESRSPVELAEAVGDQSDHEPNAQMVIRPVISSRPSEHLNHQFETAHALHAETLHRWQQHATPEGEQFRMRNFEHCARALGAGIMRELRDRSISLCSDCKAKSEAASVVESSTYQPLEEPPIELGSEVDEHCSIPQCSSIELVPAAPPASPTSGSVPAHAEVVRDDLPSLDATSESPIASDSNYCTGSRGFRLVAPFLPQMRAMVMPLERAGPAVQGQTEKSMSVLVAPEFTRPTSTSQDVPPQQTSRQLEASGSGLIATEFNGPASMSQDDPAMQEGTSGSSSSSSGSSSSSSSISGAPAGSASQTGSQEGATINANPNSANAQNNPRTQPKIRFTVRQFLAEFTEGW